MRVLLAAVIFVMLAQDSQAGPFRRRPPQPTNSAGRSPSVATQPTQPTGVGSPDALDEVNQNRARHGLRPFIQDPGLTQGAYAAASFRASNGIAGHVKGQQGDFAFLPSGTSARSAGCGAWRVGLVTTEGDTWGTCCAFDNYTYAGAAWVLGADGKRYMHLFVR